MAYGDDLKSSDWQKRRLYIFERDKFKCQAIGCDNPNTQIEVHHIDYLSFEMKPWEYPDDMLITLCKKCHSKEQLRPKAENDLLTALKMKSYLMQDIVALTAFIYTDNRFALRLLTHLRKIQDG